MTDCCAPNSSADTRCPSCGEPGHLVGSAPVRAHRPQAVEGGWRYCPTVGCGVVFCLGDATVDEDHVITQVGVKGATKPTPVCFCFAHTSENIHGDLVVNDGVSTIKASVKAAVTDGLCACEHLNPSGACCLPDIHRAVKQARALLAPSVGADG